MNMQGVRPCCTDGVHHQRERRDVVQVGVGQEDVLDLAHLVQGQVANTGAGVDQGVLVNQEGRGPAVLGDCAGTT
jgi:hypothetical protein